MASAKITKKRVSMDVEENESEESKPRPKRVPRRLPSTMANDAPLQPTPSSIPKATLKDSLTNPIMPLFIVVAFTLTAIFVMSVLMNKDKKGPPDPKIVVDPGSTTVPPRVIQVCQTPECIKLSYQLMSYRNPDTDPCSDFFQSTCGRYSNPPQDLQEQHVLRRITDLLQQNSSITTNSKTLNTMKIIYQKCEEVKKDPTLDVIPMNCAKMALELFPRGARLIEGIAQNKKEKLKITSDMAEKIRNGYINYLNGSEIVKNEKFSIEKLKNLKIQVGYPGDFDDNDEEALIPPDDSWATISQKLHKPEQSPFKFHSFYSNPEETLFILLPIIDDPKIFDLQYPQYAKLASVGVTVADSMTTVIQDTVEQRECAKHLGLDTTWQIYKKSAETTVIPGFDDTDKLFFYINAMDYCSSNSLETLNGLLSHSEHFTETFKCGNGSKLVYVQCGV